MGPGIDPSPGVPGGSLPQSLPQRLKGLMFNSVYMCLHAGSVRIQVPAEARGGTSELQEPGLQAVVSGQHGCWETNSGPLQEQPLR